MHGVISVSPFSFPHVEYVEGMQVTVSYYTVGPNMSSDYNGSSSFWIVPGTIYY